MPSRLPLNMRQHSKETDTLMKAERGTLEGQRLLALAKLIEEYEAVHFPMSPPKSLGEE
jgi:antitoxin component HigA of HigAB toxin-antitoxin module